MKPSLLAVFIGALGYAASTIALAFVTSTLLGTPGLHLGLGLLSPILPGLIVSFLGLVITKLCRCKVKNTWVFAIACALVSGGSFAGILYLMRVPFPLLPIVAFTLNGFFGGLIGSLVARRLAEIEWLPVIVTGVVVGALAYFGVTNVTSVHDAAGNIDTPVGTVVALSSNDDFSLEVEESTIPVVVVFWSPRCPDCAALAPVVNLASVHLDGKVKFASVNIDEKTGDLKSRFKVTKVPTLIRFEGGKETLRKVEPKTLDDLKDICTPGTKGNTAAPAPKSDPGSVSID